MSRTFGFIGLGLIGGSLAKALRETEHDCRIIAYSRKPQLSKDLQGALDAKVADEIVYSLDAFGACDFIFLCAPVDSNISYLPALKAVLSSDTVLTDVGSVKSGIHEAIKKAGLTQNFVGGHPMTGSEKTGYEHSNTLLLENAYYILIKQL